MIRQYTFEENTNEEIFKDNRGSFIGIDDDAVEKTFYIQSDRSRKISMSVSIANDEFKQSDISTINIGTNYKALDNLQFNFDFDYADLEGSDYIEDAIYRTYGLKTEYAPLHNLFFKSYIQYGNQSKIISNNFVVSYEYTRGNFLYLSYNENGTLWDSKEYDKGTFIKNYQLNRRTFSLKWSNSFYF